MVAVETARQASDSNVRKKHVENEAKAQRPDHNHGKGAVHEDVFLGSHYTKQYSWKVESQNMTDDRISRSYRKVHRESS